MCNVDQHASMIVPHYLPLFAFHAQRVILSYGVIGIIKQAGKNYAGGLASDLGGRLTGQTSKNQTSGTSLGGRMANTMNAQRDLAKSERELKSGNKTDTNKGDKNENTIY